MSEVRLTFSTGDFSAVSQALIRMGVSFRVDPLTRLPEEEPGEVAASRGQPRSKPAARKAKAAKPSRPQDTRTATATAAERLREAISRTTGDAVPFPPAARIAEEED
jgi:hypothetical protein